MILLKVFDKLISKIKGVLLFTSNLVSYSFTKKSERFPLKVRNIYPCFSDRTTTTDFDRHYVYHVAWAFRKVIEARPDKHIDISSSLFFCSSLSSIIPTEFYDYRPAQLKLSNLTTHFSDLCKLPFADNSISSLSCMHVVEHVGLGRYGDTLDPEGDLTAIKELQRVVRPGGTLLFVVPTGRERVQFNAHRIYASSTIKKYFHDWELKEFYLIPDKIFSETPIIDPADDISDLQNYGCGCFEFKKVHA